VSTISGDAQAVLTSGAPAHLSIGEGVRCPPVADPPPGVVVRIAVERTGGVGPWA
jgi:hypothetical protein